MRPAPLLATLLALTFTVGGCSGFEEPPVPGQEGPTPGAGTTVSDADGGADRPSARTLGGETEPPPWVTRPPLTRAPAPGATDPPRAVPSPGGWPPPEAIGPGWSYRSATGEPGATSGPAPEREVAAGRAVRATVPRGCPGPTVTPPVRAAQVAYVASGEWVDVTRLETRSPRAAAALAQARRETLLACRRQQTGPGGRLVSRVVDLGEGALLSDRTPGSDAYVDVAALDGATLVVVTRRTEDQPTLRTARAVATVFSGGRVPGGLG